MDRPTNVKEVIKKSDALAAKCWEVVSTVPGSQKLGYIAQSLVSILEKIDVARVVIKDENLECILEGLEMQLSKALQLIHKSCEVPLVYKILRGQPTSENFKDICLGLSLAVQGLHSLLSTFQGSEIETLMAEVRRVEKGLKNAEFPVDKAHVTLFTETRKIASQIYNKQLNPREGATTIRCLLDKVAGTAECKAQWKEVSRQLFKDVEEARERKDGVEEHYFQQLLLAVEKHEPVKQIPPEFRCPISLEVMKEPVLLIETGVTYDKTSIETWLHSYGHGTCPVSRKELKSTAYAENRFARILINDWMRDNVREHEVQTETSNENDYINPCDPSQREGIGFLYSTALAGAACDAASNLVDLPNTGGRNGFEGDPPTNPEVAVNQQNRNRRWYLPQPSCICRQNFDSADITGSYESMGSSVGGSPAPEPGPSCIYPAQSNPLYAHGQPSTDHLPWSDGRGSDCSFQRQPLRGQNPLSQVHDLPVLHADFSSGDVVDEVPMQFGVSPYAQSVDNARSSLRTPPPDVLETMKKALKVGDVDQMESLLSKGWKAAFTDERGYKPLHNAAYYGCAPMVRLLVEHGCSVDVETVNEKATALYIAAKGGHLEVVRTLLEHRANIMTSNQGGWTPLHIAADHAHSGVVQTLLDHAEQSGLRMYIALTTRAGWTALHHAARCGSQECILILVSYPHLKDRACNVGFSALHVAVDNGHISAIVALLNAGANVNMQSRDGWTALHIAQDKNNVQIGRILLSRGAHPDIAGKGGFTALHRAALHNHIEFAKLLVLEGRADLKLKTKPESGHGKKAVRIAHDKHHEEIYKFLFKRSLKKFFSPGK